jgi:hypothetical protein
MTTRALAVAAAFCSVASAFSPVAAQVGTLPAFLEGVAAEQRLSTPLRADAQADIDGLQGKKQDRVVLEIRASGEKTGGNQVIAEFEKAKVKVLALGPGNLHISSGGSAKKAANDTPVAGTSWTAEDFLEFSPDRCASLRIADLVADALTLLCEPKPQLSQYSLMVYKFDRQKFVPLQVLLYKDTMSNLVKMTKYDDFAAVGKKWRPSRIVMQDFKLRTRDVFQAKWAEAPGSKVELFDRKSFSVVSAPR